MGGTRSSAVAGSRYNRPDDSYAAAEQAHGSPEKEADGRRIDEESTELRQPILACRVGEADKQRSDERAAQAAQAADRDDDQEVNELLERIGRLNGDDIGAERPAQAGQTAADREGDRKEPARVNP